jgi:hypothetical protein
MSGYKPCAGISTSKLVTLCIHYTLDKKRPSGPFFVLSTSKTTPPAFPLALPQPKGLEKLVEEIFSLRSRVYL